MQLANSCSLLVAAFPVTPEVVGNAVVVSEAVRDKGILTTTTVVHNTLVFAQTALGMGILTRDNPHLSPADLSTLDARGIIKMGSTVRYGDVLVSKLAERSTGHLSGDKKLMRNDTLEYLNQDPGEVVGVRLKAKKRGQCCQCGDVHVHDGKCPHCGGIVENTQKDDLSGPIVMEVAVDVMIRRSMVLGDVLEDDLGNKVVVAQVLPETVAGRTGPAIDMWVHPNSALAARLESSEILHNVSCRVDHLELKKTTLLLEDKIRARATGPYSLITQMPLGKYFPGQLVTRDTARALFQAGYRQNLQEMLTIKSDAVEGRCRAYEATLKGEAIPSGVPEATYNLMSYLKALGIEARLSNRQGNAVQLVDLDEGSDSQMELLLDFAGASAADIRSWSSGEVKKPETINYRTYRPENDGLFCERIFGPEKDWECACGKYRGMEHEGMICDQCGVKISHSKVRRRRMAHVELEAPVVHPWFLTADVGLAQFLTMDQDDLRKVVYHREFLVMDRGNTDLRHKQLLTPVDHESARKKYGPDSFQSEMGGAAIRQLLRRDKPTPCNLDWIVLDTIPVLPPDLRPLVLLDSGNFATSDLNDLYRRVVNRNNRLKKLRELDAPSTIIWNERRCLQEAVDALFDNGRTPHPIPGSKDKPLVSLTDLFVPVARQLGEKRTDYSARGIVIPDATLEAGSAIGLPMVVVQVLFKLWAIRLVRDAGLADTVKAANEWIDREARTSQCQEVYRQVLDRHPVLVIAGTQKIIGLQPKMVEGEVIRLHPYDARKLGVTFTGEMVTLHVPLSQAAIDEIFNPDPNPDTSSIFGELTPNGLVAHLAVGHDPFRLQAFDRVLLGIDRGSSPAVPIPAATPVAHAPGSPD